MNREFYICSDCGLWSAGLSRWLNGRQTCARCDDARDLAAARLAMARAMRPRPATYEEAYEDRLEAHRRRRNRY